MLGNVLKKIVGTKNDRELKRLAILLDEVNNYEPDMMSLSDAELRNKSSYFKEKLLNGFTIDDILTEAFAVAREASRRTLLMRPFEAQVLGGIVLHEGKIAEMKTGEGKTIVALLPLYLNALSGRGVHLVTVNDYLSKHQGEGMGAVYNYLGLSTGIIQSNQISYKFIQNHTNYV